MCIYIYIHSYMIGICPQNLEESTRLSFESGSPRSGLGCLQFPDISIRKSTPSRREYLRDVLSAPSMGAYLLQRDLKYMGLLCLWFCRAFGVESHPRGE